MSSGASLPSIGQSRVRARFSRRLAPGLGRPPVLLLQIVVLVAAVLVWQLLYAVEVATHGTLPSPISVGEELWTLAGTSAFWHSILQTFTAWGLGLLIAAVIAIPVGIFLGASSTAYRASRSTIDFVRTLPPIALIPIIALLYGATVKTSLVLIVFASLWPLMLQAMYGIRQLDPVARDTARTYRLGRWRTARSVLLPSALPYIGTGVRISSAMSLLLAVGVEFIAESPGLGKNIAAAQAGYRIVEMYAYIVTAAFLGVLLTAAIIFAERRLLGWHPSHRKAV
jgi:ABC-type nitrate/sulfonate/bicarbonate transport system permease component